MSPYSKPSIIQEALNNPEETAADTFFHHYGAEIPIEEIRSPMAVPNGHWESN